MENGSRSWQRQKAAGPSDILDILTSGKPMLNSGIVAISQACLPAVVEAIDLADNLHRIEPVFNIEQFALSAMLQRHGEVRLTGPMVTHYWGYRRHIYHHKVSDALAKIGHEYSLSTAISLPKIRAPEIPFTAKIASRIVFGLRPVDSAYRFAWLCRSCCLQARNPVDRNIWAATALHMLKQSQTRNRTRKDFRAFLPDKASRLGISIENQENWSSFWEQETAS